MAEMNGACTALQEVHVGQIKKKMLGHLREETKLHAKLNGIELKLSGSLINFIAHANPCRKSEHKRSQTLL